AGLSRHSVMSDLNPACRNDKSAGRGFAGRAVACSIGFELTETSTEDRPPPALARGISDRVGLPNASALRRNRLPAVKRPLPSTISIARKRGVVAGGPRVAGIVSDTTAPGVPAGPSGETLTFSPASGLVAATQRSKSKGAAPREAHGRTCVRPSGRPSGIDMKLSY